MTPSKIKKRKSRIVTGDDEEVEKDNIRSISSLVPDPVTYSTDKDELVIAANVRSPIFKQMVQPYHVRLMMEANSIYIALVFFIDILIRDRTIHDDEAKQAHSYAPVGNLFLLLHFLEQCMATSTTLLSDRRILDFSSRPISYYAKDLNLRKYYLELLKEAKLIKSHNPETDVDNPENIFKIVFNAISKLNVTMARQFKQLYVMYDNNLEKAWRNLLVIAADTYAATHNGDQPILQIERPKDKQEGSNNTSSKETNRQSSNKNKKMKRRNESNEKGENKSNNRSDTESPNKKQRSTCDHCGGNHASADCWSKAENADKRPPYFNPKTPQKVET